MPESNKYKANGAALMAFEATGSRISYGVNALGNRCGVYGGSLSGFPREIAFDGVGVWGDGKVYGVSGRGASDQDSVGVRGEGRRAGVEAFCAEGAAVTGTSGRGRGAVFSGVRAQVRLVPDVVRPPRETDFGELLPADGMTGDLLAVSDDRGVGASLWFCARGQLDDIPATWNQVSLGPSVTGKRIL